jgi:hypothetical protein
VSSPLDDARAKLRRAHFHTEALRADIANAGQGEPYTIPSGKISITIRGLSTSESIVKPPARKRGVC